MNISYLLLGAATPSLFCILVYNDPTSIVTKTDLTGTEKLSTFLMKLFVSFIYEGICKMVINESPNF